VAGVERNSLAYRQRLYKHYLLTQMRHVATLTAAARERTLRGYRKRYLRFLPQDRGVRIVDVACGTGEFVLFLQREGYRHSVGVDIGRAQLAVAKSIGAKNLVAADALDFLVGNQESFDVVAARDLIEHFTKDEVIAFLDACLRALKPGGELWISTVNAQALISPYLYADFTHEVAFTPASLMQVLLVAGFECIQVTPKGPIALDVRSGVRCAIWWAASRLISLYLMICEGRGYGLGGHRGIVTSGMLARAKRPAAVDRRNRGAHPSS